MNCRRNNRFGQGRPDDGPHDRPRGRGFGRDRAPRLPEGLYRSRSGMVMGVCKGFADYYGLSLFWLRAIIVVMFLFTGLWPVAGFYFLAALLMKPEPVLPVEDDAAREFYESYTASRPMAVSRLRRTFDNLDRRIRRMEDIVTSRDFDWERRMRD
ncbi:MAG: envelope stress response membrane protein PspC [Desulfovibrionaceae bacterium]